MMKRKYRFRSWLPQALFAVCFSLFSTPSGLAATLEDFGYQNMTLNGNVSLGGRPTLVVLLDLANTGSFAHSNSYYDNLVFNPANTTPVGPRSVNGFMLVNSHGRFHLTRVGPGLVGPVQPPGDLFQKAQTNDNFRACAAIAAAVSAGVDFSPYDVNHDGKITRDEVSIIAVDNVNPKPEGAARFANPAGINVSTFYTPPGTTTSFDQRVALVAQRVGFGTLCHEFSHGALDAEDLYHKDANDKTIDSQGWYTLMSGTIGAPDSMEICHLDPWHKMQLGWIEPRIRLLPAGGMASMAPAQMVSATDAAVILYDSAHGTKEFFLIEFRTNNSSLGPGYDDNLPGSGLAIWHVVHDDNKDLTQDWYSLGQSVWLEGKPNLQRGDGPDMVWTNGNTTPFLSWAVGPVRTPTNTKITIVPSALNGDLTFEWLTQTEIWVDFSYTGTETGTFAQPFNTLTEAANASGHGGTIKFKSPGISPESLLLAKRLELRTTNGPVTIYRP